MHQPYIAFHRGGFRGLCIPALEAHLDFFSGSFVSWQARQPQTVFLERPNRVVAMRLLVTIADPKTVSEHPSGLPVVIKQFGWRSPLHRWFRPLTGSKAQRSFRIATILREAGIATPRPLIAWDHDAGTDTTASGFITDEIPGAVTLRQLLKSPDWMKTEGATILTEMAGLVRGMHDAGIWHRDLTIGNFLVSAKPIEGKRIFVIDLSRAVHLGSVPMLFRFMDLARMKLADHWPDFFAAYCANRPEWKSQWPILKFMIRLRRSRMELWKRLKTPRR